MWFCDVDSGLVDLESQEIGNLKSRSWVKKGVGTPGVTCLFF